MRKPILIISVLCLVIGIILVGVIGIRACQKPKIPKKFNFCPIKEKLSINKCILRGLGVENEKIFSNESYRIITETPSYYVLTDKKSEAIIGMNKKFDSSYLFSDFMIFQIEKGKIILFYKGGNVAKCLNISKNPKLNKILKDSFYGADKELLGVALTEAKKRSI